MTDSATFRNMVYDDQRQRAYALIEKWTGIKRTVDPRLEWIADQRAYEAYLEVGTHGTSPITHPIQKLMDWTWPLQGTYKGVWENAAWHYYPPSWTNPIDAIIGTTFTTGQKWGWWYSDSHRKNMMEPRATHMGIGFHRVPVSGSSDRWYGILILTMELLMDVVIVNGNTFPDALAAGPLAAKLGAPILLTQRDALPGAVANYLSANRPNRAFIIGGPSAVSDGVMSTVRTWVPTVKRISGTTRYETAIAVAKFGV